MTSSYAFPIKLEEIQDKITIEFKKHRRWAILLIIFLIGFSIRYITHHELLFDPDSYWWYRLAGYYSGVKTEYFYQENGLVKDALAYYPTGRELGGMIGLPMAIGYSFKLLGFFGIQQTMENLMKYMFVFGPFFGALTVVAFFFLTRELTNSRIAFLSSLFYSVSYSVMTRNTAGDTGQESLGNFFIFLWIYLFIKASEEEPYSRRQIAPAVMSALSFFLAHHTWGGNDFYTGLGASAVLGYLLFNIKDIKSHQGVLISYSILTLGGLFISHLAFPHYYPLVYFNSTIYLIAQAAALTCVLILVVTYRGFSPMSALGIIGAGIFVLLVVTGKVEHVTGMIEGLYQSLIIGEKGTTGMTVAYYRMVPWQEFKSTLGILILSIPVGLMYLIYDFYREKNFRSIFLIIWIILGIIAFRWMIRLSLFLVPPLAITSFLLIDLGYNYTKKSTPMPKKKAKKATLNPPSKTGIIFTTIIILFIMIPVFNTGVSYASSAKFNDGGVKPWKDAGEWLKENTPEDAILVHWWDYGYHLQTFAERITIVDGGNVGPLVEGGNPNRNVDVANMFCSTEEKVSEFMKIYNPEDKPVYFLVSIEEFGKSSAINYHVNDQLFISSFSVPRTGNPEADQKTLADILSRNKISTYYVINYGNRYVVWVLIQFDNEGNFHPEWSDKLLAKLLPFNTGYGLGLRHFQMVYQNGYVYVYKYVP